jgi:hypothetical protein
MTPGDKVKKTDEQIILDDMRGDNPTRSQSAWDWEADYRFAKAIGAKHEIEILAALLKSAALFTVQIAVHKVHITKVKQRRLRALRNLEKRGLVESHWIGTGPGGYSEFGVRRNKGWWITISSEANR